MNNRQSRYEIGMIGLGVMGRNLLLNMADHGFTVAGYDKDSEKVKALTVEAEKQKIRGASDIDEFIGLLRRPRAIIVLVPAGGPVDAVIKDLRPRLDEEDLIIDGGNSYFKDTDTRAQSLEAEGIQYLGMGISGGEEGARHGPSMMPGGPKDAYERVRPIIEAAAAKVDGSTCAAWLGPGSSGHYVKMVHNGIEYGIMQLIAESYDLMKRGLGLNDDEIHQIYTAWNEGELNGYLIEITGHIFSKKDEKTGKKLIDEILDVAKQNGTGRWTSQSAMELLVPTPTIDIAVAMRNMSIFEQERSQACKIYSQSIGSFNSDKKQFLESLRKALYASLIITYAQGFALLTVASNKYKYNIDPEIVPRIWRGGCIIRAALLEDIYEAFHTRKDLPNLLVDAKLSNKLINHETDLRLVVRRGAEIGVPIPGMMASLSYLDAYRSSWLPANLIQAQRDYFGAHTYERIDAKGTFHMEWGENLS